MKAWVLHGVGDIRYEDVQKPVTKDDEVLVSVKAVGVCGSDIPRIYQTGAHKMPLVPGHEFAGCVVECGKDVNADWKNKRVGIFPLIPCRECIACKKRKYELCRNYDYLGSRRDGGFAEYVAVPERNLIELPETVTYEEAAMLEPMAVAVHAMRRVKIEQPDAVVVYGLGTIGLFMVMFLLKQNVKNILVIGNKESQKQMILRLGLQDLNYCDSKICDVNKWILQQTNGNGADIVFECIGKNETIEQAINLTAPEGHVCMVGNPYSDMVFKKAVYWKILRNQITVTGTWNSSFTGDEEDDWRYVLRLLGEKHISPSEVITHRMDLEELEQGFEIMRDKSEDYVKIMAL